MNQREYFIFILIAGLSGGFTGGVGFYFLFPSTAIAQAEEEKLIVAAKSLSSVSEECLYDVRDRGFKYDNSANCTALGALSMQYTSAGGWQNFKSLSEHARIANYARLTAWMARATSCSGGSGMSIW